MNLEFLIIIVFGSVLFLQGCSTFKGAKEGIKEDWNAIRKLDGWIQETFW